MKVLKNSKGVWDWSKIAMSICIIVVLPLVGLVYTNMADTVKVNKEDAKEDLNKVEVVLMQKVSEKSLMQYIQIQQQQTDILKKDMVEQKIIDKETLKALQNLNISVRLLEQKLN